MKLVAWDFDGVLNQGFQGDFALWQAEFEADLGLSLGTFNGFMFGEGRFADVLVGKRDLLALLTEFRALHGGPEARVVLDYWLAKDARADEEVLGWARECGLPGVIATNNEAHRAGFIWERMGFSAHMRGIFASGPLGVRKPEGGFFKAIEDWSGLEPSEILLVDDAEKNIQAAEARGWRVFHFTERTRAGLPQVLGLVP